MTPLDLVQLTALMSRASGRPEVTIGLIDGPVSMNQPDLAGAHIREVPGTMPGTCTHAGSTACLHGTFVAGILCARRDSAAPAICPSCSLLVRPLFAETTAGDIAMPSATAEELAAAIFECVEAGARVLNLSLALRHPFAPGARALEEALDHAARRGVLVVAATGNQGTLGSSVITCHPWVIPVVACDLQGKPLNISNLGGSIGQRGVSAPGDNITSLGPNGKSLTLSGTSVAAPFVTGAVALLWSAFPAASAVEVKYAITQAATSRRTTVVPPLLDAWQAYQLIRKG